MRLAREIEQEAEILRLEMGRSPAAPLVLQFSRASIDDNSFLAQTIADKSGRLAHEWGIESASMPEVPGGELTLEALIPPLRFALDRLREVKQTLDVGEEIAPVVDKDASLDELFTMLFSNSRKLNVLLDEPVAPRDVFRQLTRCVDYASRLLAPFDEAEQIPATPEYEPRKTPADVYARVFDCYRQLQRTCEMHRIEILLIQAGPRQQQVSPVEVFDLATLLAAQLARLDRIANSHRPPRDVYTPGRRLPAHVFQRAGILQQQLEQLERISPSRPHWPEPPILLP